MNELTIRKIIREEFTAVIVPELLTSEEVSKLMKISEGTLSNWRNQNRGPTYIKVEGRIRYKLSDIKAYMDAGRVQV